MNCLSLEAFMTDNIKTQNVKIPLALLVQVIYVLESLDIDLCDRSFRYDYDRVLLALNKKKEAIELRDVYADIIRAKDEDSRHWAKMRYLQQKRLINGGF